jgi:ring-1,2-phenylacetyl-CoA epoxidase subunit PaaB
MADTQWQRFEVFQQERPGRPHRNIGSVHAPDVEMALLNARDVFARRPSTVSLWIVPAAEVYARTAEELSENPDWQRASIDEGAPLETYFVFRKQSQRRAMTYVVYAGTVQADRPASALVEAVKEFDDPESVTFVWWLCPEGAILRSDDEDADSMFAPAQDKHYRLPREYHVVTQMMEVKRDNE